MSVLKLYFISRLFQCQWQWQYLSRRFSNDCMVGAQDLVTIHVNILSMYKHVFYPRSLQVVFVFQILSNIFKTLFGSTPKTLFFPKNMTSPRLPLVKAQRSFLSGIRRSREQHGPKDDGKVKLTAPPIIKRKFGTLGVLPFDIWFSR